MGENTMSDWVTHHGGPCPVERGRLLDVRYRDGAVHYALPALERHDAEQDKRSALYWGGALYGADIVAYRLHKPAPQHPPINVEAEFSADGGKWRRGRIRYRSEKHTVVEFAHTEKAYGPSVDLRSRDIPSAEDEAVEAMREQQYQVNNGSGGLRGLYRAIAAGRIPGVRLERDDA